MSEEQEHTPEWHQKEAEYCAFIKKLRKSTNFFYGPDSGRRIVEVFEHYTHDYDLSRNPLSEVGHRLAKEESITKTTTQDH